MPELSSQFDHKLNRALERDGEGLLLLESTCTTCGTSHNGPYPGWIGGALGIRAYLWEPQTFSPQETVIAANATLGTPRTALGAITRLSAHLRPGSP